MKKYKFSKEKLKTITVSLLAVGIIFTGSVLAKENDDELEVRLSEDYLEWTELSNKEKKNSLMPSTYTAEPTEDVLTKYEAKKKLQLVSSLLGKERVSLEENVGATATQSRYNMADDINLRVEHQGITSECWAFSLIKVMETNIALNTHSKNLKDFSERHMDYATSKTFLDGVNQDGFNREVGAGGIPICGLSYLTNGQGAVLEQDMPFENNENKIYLNDINKKIDTIVSDYVVLPAINKSYEKSSSGNTTSVKYYNSAGQEYTQSELNSARQMIKEHIVKYGAIASMTGGNITSCYNDSNPFKATNYNCNNTGKTRDHAITIVGWDDTYSKNNFKDGVRPSSDGAYIVLNSYGEESFNNGYLYISYEDVFIENELYGICGTSNVNYDKLYQHDFYGGIYQIGSGQTNTGYYGAVFKKENTQNEYLHSVGITLADYAKVEIYVNQSGTDLGPNSLKLVASPSTTFSPGYHTINFDEIKVTGNEFSIVVKQTSSSGKFYFSIETSLEGTLYSNVKSSNLSYYSMDGQVWRNLNSTKITGINLTDADVCIKAFTNTQAGNPNNPEDPVDPVDPVDPTDPEDPTGDVFKSTVYKINEEDIMRIEGETAIETFMKNVTTNLEVLFYDGDVIITNNKQIVKTGMTIKLSNGKNYTLIVRGDTNFDGRLSLIDVSKLIMHYNEAKGFELTGNSKKGADMNADGIINLVDVSQMIMVYNSK